MVSAYSIGNAKRSEPGQKSIDMPSPNKYLPNVPPKQSAPKWTIGGQAKRHNRSTTNVPGPGTYVVPQKAIEGPHYSFKGRYQEKTVSQSPGPGNYNQDESFSSIYARQPSYTMGVKHQTQHKDYLPGPGKYDLNSSFVSNQSIKFSTQPRLTSYASNFGPGPGQYDLTMCKKFGEKTMPSWGMGTAGRDQDLTKQNVPGPGQYKVASMLNISKNFTFKGRYSNLKEVNKSLPGPGAYSQDVSFIKQHLPAYKIGTEIRSPTNSTSKFEPGPGQYYKEHFDTLNSLQKSAPQFKMPKAQRRDLNDSNATPGPGSYTIPKIIDHIPVTIKGSKYQPKQYYLGPGPGTYNPDDSMCKHRDGSVKIVADHLRSTVRDRAPGPGQYLLKSTLEGPRWGFGSGDRSNLGSVHESVPGPGSYVIPSKIADVPKYLNCKPKYQF